MNMNAVVPSDLVPEGSRRHVSELRPLNQRWAVTAEEELGLCRTGPNSSALVNKL